MGRSVPHTTPAPPQLSAGQRRSPRAGAVLQEGLAGTQSFPLTAPSRPRQLPPPHPQVGLQAGALGDPLELGVFQRLQLLERTQRHGDDNDTDQPTAPPATTAALQISRSTDPARFVPAPAVQTRPPRQAIGWTRQRGRAWGQGNHQWRRGYRGVLFFKHDRRSRRGKILPSPA